MRKPTVDLSSTRHRVAAAAIAAAVVVLAIVVVSRGGEATVEARSESPVASTRSPGTVAVGTLAPPAEPPATTSTPPTIASVVTPPPTVPPTSLPATKPSATAPAPAPTAPAAPPATVPATAPPPAPATPPVTLGPTTTRAPAPPPPATRHRSTDAFVGLGMWLDVLDWSPSYDGAAQAGLDDIDKMAAHGVQTIYIQTSRFNRNEDVLDRDILIGLIGRAHARGMKVVGWYLPTHEDLDRDLRRLAAASNLPVDAIGVDIESTAQTDIAERNRQLVQLSIRLRNTTTKPIAAIVIPPVVTDIINTKYWPNFPWKTIADLYDVYLPMGYWTNRSGPTAEWRDAYRYTSKNIELVRKLTGKRVEVHAVGGIADKTTPEDVAGMVRAVNEQGALGASLYDYVTTVDPALWPALQPLRR